MHTYVCNFLCWNLTDLHDRTWPQTGFAGASIVGRSFYSLINCFDASYAGLGACIVFLVTVFTLYSGSIGGIAAVVIMQAGIFVDASRQLVRSVSNERFIES